MFKRRDWVPSRDNQDDSDSELSDEDREGEGSSEEGTSLLEDSGGSGDDIIELDTEEELEGVIRDWMDASKDESVKGVALRCALCDRLLLGALTFRQHIASKNHRKKMNAWDPENCREPTDPIELAGRMPNEKEGETMEDYMQRLEQATRGFEIQPEKMAAPAANGQQPRSTVSTLNGGGTNPGHHRRSQPSKKKRGRKEERSASSKGKKRGRTFGKKERQKARKGYGTTD
ncbi:unnamed protein product [Ostreobium quekettii]|uniref:Uncharacterized protein n=1 Tax=Ostreobium quekettii TaxID=121088 RepID=A0A8S1J748_9CHLO|nr:unnamed protein product [Ostreobium quekettii]|eukprot:evm.model.scf_572.1 EVM.evm.TU.scf_572.1   scf_572:23786-29703(+)